MANLTEILFAQPEQRRAVEFCVTADVVVCVRMKRFPVPGFFRVIFCLEIDSLRAPVVLLARHIVAAFEQQDFLA